MRLAPTELERFEAVDDDGQRYTVVIWQHWIDSSNLQGHARTPGSKEIRLANGGHVNPVDANTFEILATGRRITRA